MLCDDLLGKAEEAGGRTLAGLFECELMRLRFACPLR